MVTAKEILKTYWNDTIPIDPAAIAVQMGVNVLGSANFGEESGHYLPEGHEKNPTIIYNARESKVRQRFTIAHELGHHVLGHGDSPRDSAYPANARDPVERAANAFAAELLMPEETVKALIHVRGLRSVTDLRDAFGVSAAAMQYRLKDLGYRVG